MSVPRFREYLPTGDPVIPSLPAGWSVALLRNVGQFLKGRGGSKQDSSDSGVPCIRYGELYTTFSYSIRAARSFVPTELAGEYQPISRGDVLFAASGEDMADIGRSAVNLLDGPTVCGGDIVILRPTVDVLPEFLGFACDSIIAKAQKAMMGRGTTVKHIYPDELRRVVIAIPPRSQQEGIVSFLETETAKIDSLIAEQERLIALLQEKRQAVISLAVTKGLDPKVPMKDSGVEWMGAIPSHWNMSQLRHLATNWCDGPFGSNLKSDHYSDEGVRVVRLQNIRSGRFDNSNSAFVDTAHYASALLGHDVCTGDLLIAGLGDDNNVVGRACVAPRDIEPAMVKADVFRFRLESSVCEPEFVALQLTAGAQADAGVLSTGSTRSRIPLSVMSTRRVAAPPREEQVRILEALRSRLTAISSSLDDAELLIALLRERRTALITAAVTGQIDVRGLVETAA